MRVDVSRSEVLKDLVDEKLAAGAATGTRDALRVLAASRGVTLGEADEEFVEALSIRDAQHALVALSKDEDWNNIFERFRPAPGHV